jgi:hypothetical protein
MYYELLAPGNTDFVQNVGRLLGFKSARLTNVIAAIEAAQKVPGPATLRALLDAMHLWRTQDPHEFSNRGGTDGVAYRLWMEAKQALANRYHQVLPYPNPLMPFGCPGTELLGIYVPDGGGHREICHAFAYRWAIAAGKIRETPTLPARRYVGTFNAANSTPVLYPAGYAGYPPARIRGVMQTQPGDIIAMFVVPPPPHPASLGHSLIAETATVWFSANNAGTFGVGTGRSQIDTARAFPVIGEIHVGWVGEGNQWMRPDGHAVHVVYRRIP